MHFLSKEISYFPQGIHTKLLCLASRAHCSCAQYVSLLFSLNNPRPIGQKHTLFFYTSLSLWTSCLLPSVTFSLPGELLLIFKAWSRLPFLMLSPRVLVIPASLAPFHHTMYLAIARASLFEHYLFSLLSAFHTMSSSKRGTSSIILVFLILSQILSWYLYWMKCYPIM